MLSQTCILSCAGWLGWLTVLTNCAALLVQGFACTRFADGIYFMTVFGQCIHALHISPSECTSAKHACVVLQVDLSDCSELVDATFRSLSDGQPGYALNGGSPNLRCLPAVISLVLHPFACFSKVVGDQLTSRCKLQSPLHEPHVALRCAVLCYAIPKSVHLDSVRCTWC